MIYRADLTPGTIKYDVPLRLIHSYLSTKETLYGPLASAMDNIRYLEQMLRGTDHYPSFAIYMKKLAATLYKSDHSQWRTAWTDAPISTLTTDSEQSYDQLMFNNLVIETACFYEVPECLAEARRRFSAWMDQGSDKAFSPE